MTVPAHPDTEGACSRSPPPPALTTESLSNHLTCAQLIDESTSTLPSRRSNGGVKDILQSFSPSTPQWGSTAPHLHC